MSNTRIRSHARGVMSGPSGASARQAPSEWPILDETLTLCDVVLERGAVLSELRVHVRLEGALRSARDNVVLIVHALTGDARATTWWRGVVHTGGAIDPTRHAVLTANLLGGCDGTDGPRTDSHTAFPRFTTRDQAAVLARVLDALHVAAPLLICGGSLGGQVTLEFAASFPDRVRAAVVLAAPAAQTAQGIAWNAVMRRAIEVGGPQDGLALARMIGMISYRTAEGLERRFGRGRSTAGAFDVNEWLDVHGRKLVARFDCASYLALLDAMDDHDVGRGRGGAAAALRPLGKRLTGVGVVGDLLYPADCVKQWAQDAGSTYVDLPSIHGHDAFLLETTRVNRVLRAALSRAVANEDPGDARVIRMHDAKARRTEHKATSAPSTRPLRCALAGCGHVGGGVLTLLNEQHAPGNPVRIDRLLVRDLHRERAPLLSATAGGIAALSAPTTDPEDMLDDDIDVLIELIGGTTTARTLVASALRRGIRVVTANKALLASCGPELEALAALHHTRIDFEGAVGGAIPVVRLLRSGAAGVGITAVSGILNGTTNFVLDRLSNGVSLAGAIQQAQREGFAEADPARDLSGEDAEDKLRLIAWLAFGVEPRSLPVTRLGIDDSTAAWVAKVAAEGDRVRSLARCSYDELGQLTGTIAPVRVPRDDPWAAVRNADNRVVIESASAGSLVFHGPGAGGRATAGAVISDLLGARQ